MLGVCSLFIVISSKMLIIISFRGKVGLHYLMIIITALYVAKGLYAVIFKLEKTPAVLLRLHWFLTNDAFSIPRAAQR